MASATTKPQKRLRDFLNEQQEPFILEVYLLERESSNRWSLNGDSCSSSEKSTSFGLNKKRKALLPFCKVLRILYNKFALHSENYVLTRDHDQKKEHAISVPEPGWDHIVQFSPASSSTVFNSCSDFDEEETCIWLHKEQHSFPSHIFQTSHICNMSRRQRQRCIKGSLESLGRITLRRIPNVNEDVEGMQQRIRSCGVLLPKKITEDSLLSAAIWSLLGHSIKKENCNEELRDVLSKPNVSKIMKSKRVVHKIKRLLFDCVRDITITLPANDKRKQSIKQFMGPLELRKLFCVRTKEWGRHAGDGANLTSLLTLDYLNSITEWSKFEPHVKDISVEISDAILESMNDEIVLEMIGTLASNI